MSQRESVILAEVEGWPDETQMYFWWLVNEKGNSTTMAHMLVHRRGPIMKGSDKAFGEGQRRKMNEMPAWHRDNIVRMAKEAGVDTHNRYYMGGLGRYTDQRAWVSSTDEVRQTCKHKNLTATGIVNHQGTPMPPPKMPRLAEHLVKESMAEHLASDGRLRERMKKAPKKTSAALREKVIAIHGRRSKDPD